MSIYKGMFEACTLTINSSGEPVLPYYNMDKMQSYMDNYFKVNLSKYTNNYELNLEYLSNDGSSVCKSQCRKVRISLDAEINSLYHYQNSEVFTIKDGDV